MKRNHFHLLSASIIALFLDGTFLYAQTVDEYLDNGNDSFKRGKFDQAISEYTKAIDINPNLAKAYDNRGVAYAQEGSLSRAIADFTMATANNPNDEEAYNNRGRAYAKLGNWVQAISDYTKSISINAFYTKAYSNRALVFYTLGKYDKAWSDVHTLKEVGGFADPDFIKLLEKASGENQ